MKNRILESLILSAALIIFGGILYSAVEKACDRDRSVSVRGLAEKIVPANKANWRVRFTELGNDLPAMLKTVAVKDSEIVKFFVDRSIPREDINVNSPSVSDNFLDIYLNKKPENRYTVSSTISISSSQVEKFKKIQSEIGELAMQGIVLEEGMIHYEFTKLNTIKPQMIEEATKNAREAAEKYAKDSKSKIGKIRSAVQGVFSIDDNEDEKAPHMKKVRVVTSVVFSLE